MAERLSNYQCPNCSGPLKWNPELQKLHCEYCGSSFTQEEVESYFKEKEDQAAQAGLEYTQNVSDWTDEEAAHMREYNCPSCGAQLFADEVTAVTTCPYCNNPTVIAEQFKAKKPEYVLPFQLTKEQAKERLAQYYQKKPFLPHQFANKNHIEEIKGVYVPFWLYDGTFEADTRYECTRSRQHQHGDEIITETDHFQVYRSGSLEFQKIPADASSKMPDEYMDAIEPFEYDKLTKFSSSYMAGYMADSYDVTAEENQERVDTRMQQTTLDEMSASVIGYQTKIPLQQNAWKTQGTAHYAFLPVWMLATKYGDKNYIFAVNGQTGKVVGDLPADSKKMIQSIVVVSVIAFIVIAAIMYYMAMGGAFV